MSIENPTQPLMPLLKALRRRKLRIELLGDSARVRRQRADGESVEVYDLVRQYALGNDALASVVSQIESRLPSE